MLYVLLLVAVLIALVLFVPFRLELAGRYEGTASAALSLSWLWGLVRARFATGAQEVHLSLGGLPLRKGIRSGKKAKREKRTRRGWGSFSTPSLPAALRLLRRLLRSLAPRGEVRAVFGTGDPADTGMILGLACATLATLPLPVTVVPDFQERTFALAGALRLRILVGGLLAIALGALLSGDARRLFPRRRERRNTRWNTSSS